MRRIRLLPYGPSDGCRALSRAAGLKRLKLPHSKFRPRFSDKIVNWGHGADNLPVYWPASCFVNNPSVVSVASSKKLSLQKMKEAGVNVPDFTTSREAVAQWLRAGKRVVARTLDRASGGRGIIMCEGESTIPQAGLYTLYIPKKYEYRVHVWGNQVLDVQQKKKRKDFPEAQFNGQIRNFDKGWVFARDGVNAPDCVITQALYAVRALGLDFGAVDVGWTEKTNTATVYEVNTAPGLEGTTIEKYAVKIRSLQ